MEKIEIILEDEVKRKIDTALSEFPIEVMGYLTGSKTEYGFIVDDLLIPYQVCTGGSADVTGKDLLRMRQEYGEEKCKKIIGHFHTHGKGKKFWSGIDENQQKEYSKTRKDTLFIVGGSDGLLCRVVVTAPFLIFTDAVEIVETIDVDFLDDIKKKVREPPKPPVVQPLYDTEDYTKSVYDVDEWSQALAKKAPETTQLALKKATLETEYVGTTLTL